MEDHLKNKDRLLKEWEALCSYQAEPSTISVAQSESNIKKNRCSDAVPCEYNPIDPHPLPACVPEDSHYLYYKNGIKKVH